jgi:hypothetical protein
MMRMAVIGLTLWIALGPARAWALDCQPLEPKSGTNLENDIRGEVDAKMLGLLRRMVGVEGSISGVYNYIQKVSSYGTQAPQLYVWERLIYLKCQLLDDSALDQTEKNEQFNELLQAMLIGPPQPQVEPSAKPLGGSLFIMEAMVISGNRQQPQMTRSATKKLQAICNGERSCIVFLDEETLDLEGPFQQVSLTYFCGPNGDEVEERHRYGGSIRVSCQ